MYCGRGFTSRATVVVAGIGSGGDMTLGLLRARLVWPGSDCFFFVAMMSPVRSMVKFAFAVRG